MIRRNVSDHWSFLEEIEAPMWVDLTLEVSNNDQERSEEWFSEGHLFHQYSSRQLKSTLSHFSEENGSSDFCLQGPSSPKLPSSVSKSRGKNYRGKKWEQHKSDPSVHQSHLVKVLSATSSSSKQCSYLQSKPKSKLVDLRGPSGLKKNLVTKRNSAKNGSWLSLKPTLLGSTSNNRSQTKQKSGISFESHQQEEEKVLHVSGQVFGNSTGLSSIITTGLRKSCVTRQASRVEIISDTGHRSGHKSSGKSSVGSSSHPLYDAKRLTSQVEDREITPNSKHTVRTYQALPNKKKRVISGVSSTISNTYERGKSRLAKPGCPEIANPNVQHQNCCSKASLPLRVNAPNSFAKEKPKEMLEVPRLNKSVSKEKENLRRRLPESQTNGNTGRFQKGITGNVSLKGDRGVLVGLKLSDVRGNEGKAIKNVTQKGLLSMR